MLTLTPTEWRAESFPSGTCIVRNGGAKAVDLPWLYVFGPKPVGPKDEEGDDPRAERTRYQMCEQLAVFLNGGECPRWLSSLRRVSETKLLDVDGSEIIATGPMYDANPPQLDWRQREDVEAIDSRARLIDRLWNEIR